jgi:hypothetical protein
MTDWATRRSEGDDTIDVEREWNPGGVGNQVGDEHETSDAPWNPGGVGNATEDELTPAADDPDAAEVAGE